MPEYILFLIAFLFLFAALHPFVTFPLSLRLARKAKARPLDRRPAADPTLAPTLAMCFCAYNEEAVIAEKAENLLALKRAIPSLEIFAYVDGRGDRTGEILQSYGKDITVDWSSERHGKSHGMNRIVGMATADVIVFTDANVMLDGEALANLRGYFEDPSVGCVCGQLRYLDNAGSATASTGSLYWKLEEAIKQLESDTGSVMGADGSIFAIRRSLHRPVPADIIDDMYVSFSILLDGHRIVRAPDAVAYEQSVSSASEEFRRKVRIACQAMNVHRLLWPRLRGMDGWNLYKYVSHKLMRWLSIFTLALSALFFTAGFLAQGWIVATIVLWAAGLLAIALGAMGVKPFAQGWNVLLALVGAGLGVVKSFTGERFQTWTPASSIRRPAS